MMTDKRKGPKIRSTEKKENFSIKEVQTHRIISKEFYDMLHNNNIKYKKIGKLAGGFYYKYMDLETALLCLESNTIRFVEPSMWQDNYESRFYNANYDNVLEGKKEIEECPLIYANCVTRKKNNEAAWKIYTYGKTGLGARCVEFMLNRTKLREELIKNSKDCTILEGNVTYIWEGDIDTLHQKFILSNKKRVANLWYNFFFEDFSQTKYLNLLLLKRDAFEHEQESRIMIIPNTPPTKKGKKHTKKGKVIYGDSVIKNINWGEIIQEVRYDDSCTQVEVKLLSDAIRKTVNFSGTDEEWEKDRRSPKCYHIYGIRKSIKIQRK